jgi:hypothetical protein
MPRVYALAAKRASRALDSPRHKGGMFSGYVDDDVFMLRLILS